MDRRDFGIESDFHGLLSHKVDVTQDSDPSRSRLKINGLLDYHEHTSDGAINFVIAG